MTVKIPHLIALISGSLLVAGALFAPTNTMPAAAVDFAGCPGNADTCQTKEDDIKKNCTSGGSFSKQKGNHVQTDINECSSFCDGVVHGHMIIGTQQIYDWSGSCGVAVPLGGTCEITTVTYGAECVGPPPAD